MGRPVQQSSVPTFRVVHAAASAPSTRCACYGVDLSVLPTAAATAVVEALWRQLYKNRSSGKTDSQQEKSSWGSPILLKIVSENRFSGKTYFYTTGPCAAVVSPAALGVLVEIVFGRPDRGNFGFYLSHRLSTFRDIICICQGI